MEKFRLFIKVFRKIFEAFLIICLAGFVLFMVTSIGNCANDYFYGDFEYKIENKNIYITGLSGEGKEKKEILLISTISGKKVDYYKTPYVIWGDRRISFVSDRLKKVYVPYDVADRIFNSCLFDHCSKMEKLIINTSIIDDALHFGVDRYYPSQVFDNYFADKVWEDKITDNVGGSEELPEEAYTAKSRRDYDSEDLLLPANVSYYLNYENAANGGLYFIDDYDNEIISYKVTAPNRDGYEFGGWYKEPECVNEWNFKTDLVYKPLNEKGRYEADENGKLIYSVTNLYAKWIKL